MEGAIAELVPIHSLLRVSVRVFCIEPLRAGHKIARNKNDRTEKGIGY